MRRLLLDSGADVHTTENMALVLAAARGRLKIVQMLLAAGANPSAGPEENTPLSRASANGHAGIVKLLLSAGAPADGNEDCAIVEAAGNGHRKIVQMLLKAGAHADADDSFALSLAWCNGYPDIVNDLKRAGAHWPDRGTPESREECPYTAVDAAIIRMAWNSPGWSQPE
jgi:ankyrin repeat protein